MNVMVNDKIKAAKGKPKKGKGSVRQHMSAQAPYSLTFVFGVQLFPIPKRASILQTMTVVTTLTATTKTRQRVPCKAIICVDPKRPTYSFYICWSSKK